MKRYMKKGIAISLSAMLVFEIFSILPVYFVSYARVGEEEISNVEIMESRKEIKPEEDNKNVSRSLESDFDILFFDNDGIGSALLMGYYGDDEIVVIPGEIGTIYDRAFSGNNLTKVILPEKVKYIGKNAFNGCARLTYLNLPEGITEIEESVFAGCSSLTELVLPKGLTHIGHGAFSGCSSLTELILPEGVMDLGYAAFISCRNLTKIKLPEKLTHIEQETFMNCSNLTGLTLPKELMRIGNAAFRDCNNLTLTEVMLPEKLEYIGRYAFKNCSSLTELILPEGITKIEESVFAGCSSLTKVILPKSLISIENNDFSGCSSLTELILPEGLTSIGNSAFSGCSSLTKVTLPKSLISIENNAFSGCSSLTELILPEGLTSIGNSAFSGCSSLTKVTLPEGLTSIEDHVFHNCSSLIELILPERLTSIKDYAFSGCSSLTELILPESLTYIGMHAMDDKSLEKVIFPKGSIDINFAAFSSIGSKDSKLTIYCYAGSDAEEYAKEKKIPYQLIGNGDEVEETLVSSFSIDSTAMGTLDSTIKVKGSLVLNDDIETSSSILSSEVEKISWVSSDSSIAEVTNWSSESEEDNRKAALQICVTPYQEGRVTITGKTSNGLTASCEVVISKVEEIEEKEASVTLEIGENAEIYVKGEGKVRDSVTITGSAWEVEGKIYTTLEELEKKCDTPERDSYRFEGWELEGKKLSKNSPILDGNRLRAVWIKVKNDSENNNNSSSGSSSGSKTKGNRIINEDTAGCYNLSKTEIFSLSQGISLILGKDTQIGLVIKNEEGIMAVSEEGDIVLRKNSGSMAEKEWVFVEGAWYYFGSDRKAVSGWIQNEGGKWYYLNPESKKMETGWVEMADGKWYYLDKENGEMRTGWQRMEEGDWYFMNPKTGEMMTGWICVEEKYYYLDETGVCAMNTVTPDGYRVDETGMWIK